MALGCIVQYCILPCFLPSPCRTHPFQLPPAYLVLLTALGCGVHVLCVVYVTSKSRLRGCAYMFPLEFSDEQKDAMEKEDIVCGVAMPRLLRCLEYVLCTATHTCCTREAWWLLGGIEPMGPVQYGYCTLKKWPLRAAAFQWSLSETLDLHCGFSKRARPRKARFSRMQGSFSIAYRATGLVAAGSHGG